MIVTIADTHAALWYLFSDSRLGSKASAFIDDAPAKGDQIGVSAISLAERKRSGNRIFLRGAVLVKWEHGPEATSMEASAAPESGGISWPPSMKRSGLTRKVFCRERDVFH